MEIVEFEAGEFSLFAANLKKEHEALVKVALEGLGLGAWDFENETKLFRKIDADVWCLRLGPSLWHARRDLGMPASPQLKTSPVLLRIYFHQPSTNLLVLLGFLNKTIDARGGNHSEKQSVVIEEVRKRRSKLREVFEK